MLIIQFPFSKMFVNLLFLKGHHSIIPIKNLSVILLMDPSNCIISFNTKIFVILFFITDTNCTDLRDCIFDGFSFI